MADARAGRARMLPPPAAVRAAGRPLLALLATAGAASLLVTGAGGGFPGLRPPPASSGPTVVAPPTGFGGYVVESPVSSISAEWDVAAISSTSPAGTAATWIGAGQRQGGAFIQVGTIELSLGRGDDSYVAFFSDTALDFHPIVLGSVAAGDRVAARLTRRGGGWRVALVDLASRQTMAVPVPYGAGQRFGLAEWLQEDPAASALSALDVPYPRLSAVEFDRLLLNGAAPHLDLRNGQTLTATGDRYFVPKPLGADSFVLLAASGPARRYLIDAGRVDRVLSAFAVERAGWAAEPAATRALEIDRVARSYRSFAAELRRQSWPASARPALLRLAGASLRLAGAYRAWARAGGAVPSAAYRHLHALRSISVTRLARSALGLPGP